MYTIIREHKLRKRAVFSLDMVSFRTNICLQFHNYVLLKGVAYYPVMAPMPQWEVPHTKVEQTHRTVALLHKDFHICVKNQELIFSAVSFVCFEDPCIIAAPCQGTLNVHVEQNVESTSHVSYSFFILGCKTTVFWVIHCYAKCSSLRNKGGTTRLSISGMVPTGGERCFQGYDLET